MRSKHIKRPHSHVSLINNGGDIGKTLKDLGSQDSLKGLIASMATAGALSSLGSHLHINGKPLNQITVNDGFTAHLGKAVVNNLASATLNSALTGASLQDSIQTALVSALISAGAGQVANSIGDHTPHNPALKALAHALAGCVAGSAGQGGSQGCTAGAAGAVVGELAAQWYNPEGDLSRTADTVAFASLMAGVAGALTGDGSAQSVNTAATTGANAALNNYLMHTEAARRAELRQQCSSPSGCSAELIAELERLDVLDKQRDIDLRNACSPQAGGSPGSAACRSQYALLQAARATYGHYYLSPELKSSSNFAHMSAQDWLQVHEDVSKVVQFLNWYDPQREPPAGSTAPTRDRLTNLPLDEQGRYTRTVVIGGQMYQPKYHACATAECMANNANLDRSDPATQAYVQALHQQVLKDIQTGATVGVLVNPVGAVGATLTVVGTGAAAWEAVTSDSVFATSVDKGIELGSERAALTFFEKVLQQPPAAAARFVALINLAGGWEAFRERVKIDLMGAKLND